MGTTTLYYVSDVHGYDRCFRKFLNAAKFYRADTLVMGGDILVKAIVFLEEVRPGVYTTEELGRQLTFTGEAEVQAFAKTASDQGLYPYLGSQGAPQVLHERGGIAPP